MTSETTTNEAVAPRFAIYRAAEAPNFDELTCMEAVGVTPVIAAGIEQATAEGADDGSVVKMLFSMPGMSLTYAWFKSGFPLPLHTHDSDCLYYIVAGSVRMGATVLEAGDGFFVETWCVHGQGEKFERFVLVACKSFERSTKTIATCFEL